jgi:YD repeat-containing protein
MEPKMKAISAFITMLIIVQSAFTQYYYQDIIATRQVAEKWNAYKDHKVKTVNIFSFESDEKPTEGFSCNQNVRSDYSEISTHTKSELARESTFTTYYNANGQPIKTYDTSKAYQSITEYAFDASGNISSITNSSLETINNIKNTEQHFWRYGADGKLSAMIKVKNGNDTTYVRFIFDEKGNLAEERAVHNKIEAPAVFYYYDENRQLTDIVRYNPKARRLLPDYIFTYGINGQLSSMLFVPEGSTEYNKWVYEYNESGLRIKETCYSKQKEMLGKIEYEYSFNK